MKRFSFLFLLPLLLVGGCSSQVPPNFSVAPNGTSLFFYASYDSEKTKPFFGDSFWLTVDNYAQEKISAGQYIEVKSLLPGEHVITVEEVSFGGNTLGRSTLTVRLDSTTPRFVVEKIAANGKASLVVAPEAQGKKEVAARTRKSVYHSAPTGLDLF